MSDDLLVERLLRVVDEGRRTATYKLALLLGLIDTVAQHPGAEELPTRTLAEEIVEIYYPQVRLYAAGGGAARELRQIAMKSSPPVAAVLRLRVVGDRAGCHTARQVRAAEPNEHARAVDTVEDTFVRYPIPLLQVVGNGAIPFLYDLDWDEGTSVAHLRKHGRDRIRLRPGVSDRLVVLGPLLRPLIELHWTRDVARWTQLDTEEERLRAHLFGTSRTTFPLGLRDALREGQENRCFYCDAELGAAAQVDHFLAWSRWPNDAIENLVLADRCNGDKSDHLAAEDHLERWVARLRVRAEDLSATAARLRWPSDPSRSTAYVRSTYQHLAPGTPLWVRGRDFATAAGPLTFRDS